MTLVYVLDERAKEEVCFVSMGFWVPIVHVLRVKSQIGEKVDNIHEHLLVGAGDFCNDHDFLAIGGSFEEELWCILWVVSSDEGQVVLADDVWSWLAIS
jgi:hypothetical protein